MDDAISEPRESFGIHLRRTPDHGRSTLMGLVDGVIEICDDDGQYSMYNLLHICLCSDF